MNRYQKVMENARLIMGNPHLKAKHIEKTQPCRNMPCKKKENCKYAHSDEEYKLPLCLYEEFCKKMGCQMYHPNRETRQEFMERNHIGFVTKTVSQNAKYIPHNRNTKMCTNMTFDTPCQGQYTYCTFAHHINSIYVQGCDCQNKECNFFHLEYQDFFEYVMERRNEKGILDWHIEEYKKSLIKEQEIQKNIRYFLENLESKEYDYENKDEKNERQEKETKSKWVDGKFILYTCECEEDDCDCEDVSKNGPVLIARLTEMPFVIERAEKEEKERQEKAEKEMEKIENDLKSLLL